VSYFLSASFGFLSPKCLSGIPQRKDNSGIGWMIAMSEKEKEITLLQIFEELKRLKKKIKKLKHAVRAKK